MNTAIRSLAHAILDRNLNQTARVMEPHSPFEVAEFLLHAPVKSAVQVVARMGPDFAGACLASLPDGLRRQIVRETPVSTTASMLRLLSQEHREDLLEGLPADIRAPIDHALQCAPQSAGAFADPWTRTLYRDLTVDGAIEHLCRDGSEVMKTVFVLDRSQGVVGSLSPVCFLSAERATLIASLGLDPAQTVPEDRSVVSVVTSDTYEGGPVAVVDPAGTFVGVLHEDLLRSVAKLSASKPASYLVATFAELYGLASYGLLTDLTVDPTGHDVK